MQIFAHYKNIVTSVFVNVHQVHSTENVLTCCVPSFLERSLSLYILSVESKVTFSKIVE